MNVGDRRLDLVRLQGEIASAGVPIRALGRNEGEIFTYNDDGEPIDLPPEAEAVVEAHVTED